MNDNTYIWYVRRVVHSILNDRGNSPSGSRDPPTPRAGSSWLSILTHPSRDPPHPFPSQGLGLRSCAPSLRSLSRKRERKEKKYEERERERKGERCFGLCWFFSSRICLFRSFSSLRNFSTLSLIYLNDICIFWRGLVFSVCFFSLPHPPLPFFLRKWKNVCDFIIFFQ